VPLVTPWQVCSKPDDAVGCDPPSANQDNFYASAWKKQARNRQAFFTIISTVAKILLQNGAILRNTLRMLNRQTPSVGNALQSSETMRNLLGLS